MRLGDGDRVRPKVARPRVLPDPAPAPGRDQLMAIAAAVFEPTIDDFEWRERIKLRVGRLGCEAASPDQISLVMALLDKRLKRTIPEPVREERREAGAPQFSRDEALRFYRDIETRFKARRVLP